MDFFLINGIYQLKLLQIFLDLDIQDLEEQPISKAQCY